MKNIVCIIVIFSAFLLLTACGDKKEEASAASVQELQDAKSKAFVETRLREKAESEKQETQRQLQAVSDDAKSSERTVWILGIFVVLALLVGIAIGSASRKRADSKNSTLD